MVADIAMASPQSPLSPVPLPIGGNISWCKTQNPDLCVLGILQDFDTGELDAYMFNYNCKLLNSTNDLVTGSNFTFTWAGPQGYTETGYIYVHNITGNIDVFWFDKIQHQSGWSWEAAAPKYYEYRAFRCGAAGRKSSS